MKAAENLSLRDDPGTPQTCLGRTCLKWTDDGELSRPDLQLILARLARVDAEARDGVGGVEILGE